MIPTTSFGVAGSFLMAGDWALTAMGNAMIKQVNILFISLFLDIDKCTGIGCFYSIQDLFQLQGIEKKGKKG
jgi:hypothetical protein